MNNTPKIAGSLVIGAILLIGAYVVLSGNMDDTDTATQSNDTTTAVTQQVPSSEVSNEASDPEEEELSDNEFVDGTYEAAQSYRVPAGNTEDISIAVTVQDGIISAIEVETVATNEQSVRYQSQFDPVINAEVEGKPLDSADIGNVGGASLTSAAFNDLLDEIRNQART